HRHHPVDHDEQGADDKAVSEGRRHVVGAVDARHRRDDRRPFGRHLRLPRHADVYRHRQGSTGRQHHRPPLRRQRPPALGAGLCRAVHHRVQRDRHDGHPQGDLGLRGPADGRDHAAGRRRCGSRRDGVQFRRWRGSRPSRVSRHKRRARQRRPRQNCPAWPPRLVSLTELRVVDGVGWTGQPRSLIGTCRAFRRTSMRSVYRLGQRLILAASVALLWGVSAMAQTPAAAPKIDSGDTAWMLTSVALVLMMTIPGLALFYGGMVRKMNVLATVMQSFAVACLVTLLWMAAGYSLAFTPGSPFLGGLGEAMLRGLRPGSVSPLATTIPESVYMTFQMTFAVITPALICG